VVIYSLVRITARGSFCTEIAVVDNIIRIVIGEFEKYVINYKKSRGPFLTSPLAPRGELHP
jgi:hypothetical protein